jgi:Alpha-L-arabinofuranosidase
MCEDIGAQPLPILNCGMACQFNTGELCPLDQLDTYIQDALDLVEFANGPASSTWGAKRAAMGHPDPFNVKLIGIGNEQWDEQYIERYAKFHKTLKGKYPDIQLISSAGPSPDDRRFKFAWPELRKLKADIVDEHCYANPEWFFKNTHRYDDYDPTGPKVFMGEYAAQSDKVVSVKNRNNWECALAEAAYMTGLERNAAVVRMASYAPLFAHIDAWQWTPNLIWTDNLRVFGTPNYYVQQLFSRNRGDVVLPIKCSPDAETSSGSKLYASAVRDESGVILKLVNPAAEPQEVAIQLEGPHALKTGATAVVLAGKNLTDENSLDAPTNISPHAISIDLKSPSFNQTVPGYSLMVLRLPL